MVSLFLLSACSLMDDRALIEEGLDAALQSPSWTVEEADLDGLPAPLARYLDQAGVVGQPYARTWRTRGQGTILFDGKNEKPLEFEQYNTLPTVTRSVLMEAPFLGLVEMEGHDSLDVRGDGRMSIRLNGLPFQETWGPEMDQSALVTWLAELQVVPTAFFTPGLSFEEVDDDHTIVRVESRGRSVEGVLTFADDELVDFTTDDRFRSVGDTQVPQRWSAPCVAWGELDGLRICTRAKGIWYEEGEEPLEYADFAFEEVEIDQFGLWE